MGKAKYKPSLEDKGRDFERMLYDYGYRKAHKKGTHIVWTDGVHTITLGTKGNHLKNELAWKIIKKFNFDWKKYF